jgi:phosphoribosylamine--glycine ligase
MRVLVVGGGGREHALAWWLATSPRVDEVLCAPGNGGTPGNRPVAADDIDGIVALARSEAVDLVVVGPEVPLVAGLVDALVAAGVRTFGPSAACARLEGSKAFAKDAFARWGIPTARSVTVRDVAAGRAALATFATPPVVKASGLAAGKGVVVAETVAEADEALVGMLEGGWFGDAGAEVVLEERLLGDEVSVLAVCSGTAYSFLPLARDHKRLLDGDAGPNTGGMGAFAPVADLADPAFLAEVGATVFEPTLRGLAAEGTPYVGVLYAGLMLTADGIRVLEFNCRFGDPETQVLLPLVANDPVDLLDAAIDGRLADEPVRWTDQHAATVVLAADGYPASPRTGDAIEGLAAAAAAGCLVFHAGTVATADGPRTAGGRVLAVTAVGDDAAAALRLAYQGVAAISFPGAQHRSDIGRTA